MLCHIIAISCKIVNIVETVPVPRTNTTLLFPKFCNFTRKVSLSGKNLQTRMDSATSGTAKTMD